MLSAVQQGERAWGRGRILSFESADRICLVDGNLKSTVSGHLIDKTEQFEVHYKWKQGWDHGSSSSLCPPRGLLEIGVVNQSEK